MKGKRPRLSVLLPVFNAEDTLDEALESLRRQTFQDFEIVAIDDGSTDNTPRLLAAWAAREPRLRVVRRPHRGVVAALQAGLALCRAPLVARMDADDIALPQRLAAQVAFLEAHPQVAVVGCQVEAFPARRVGQGLQRYLAWQNALLDDEAIRREIFIESPFTHPSVVFRREVVLSVGGYRDPGWPEDYDLWLRLYLAGAHFGKVPQVLLRWRERPNRLTRIDPRCSNENFLRAKAFYLAHGPLADRDAIFLWGAGPTGRRLGRLLAQYGLPLRAYLDVDPKKVGRTRHHLPIYGPEALPELWGEAQNPALVVAVGAPGARSLIRRHLQALRLVEGEAWWFAA